MMKISWVILACWMIISPSAIARGNSVNDTIGRSWEPRHQTTVTSSATGLVGGEARLPTQLPPRASRGLHGLPPAFVPNVFDESDEVRFVAQGLPWPLSFARDRVVIPWPAKDRPASSRVELRFAGARPTSEIVGEAPLPGKANFFVGNDPSRWRADVPLFRSVRYRELYPGVDAVYHLTENRRLKGEFRIRPGASAEQIRLLYSGLKHLRVEPDGALAGQAPWGAFRESPPVTYQESEGHVLPVPCRYVLRAETEVSFEIGKFDRTKELIIDPSMVFSTYLGVASNFEEANGIAVDKTGNVYVAGAGCYGFPATPGAYSQGNPMQMSGIYVTKFDPSGKNLVYSTLIAGLHSVSEAYALAIDSAGSAYVTGYANVTDVTKADFPMVNAQDSSFGGEFDAFVLKLSPGGNALIFSTYLGNTDQDFGYDIVVDAQGTAYVGGSTLSKGFPVTSGAYQSSLKGTCDGFLSTFSSQGKLLYSTLLGGSSGDKVLGVAVDSAGYAFLTGWTSSKDFPTTAGTWSTTSKGNCDLFVVKLKPSANAGLTFGTYLGGNSADYGEGIAVDGSGKVYVTGQTSSTDFPHPNGFGTTLSGGTCPSGWKGTCPLNADGFVAALAASGKTLIYGTYLGGKEFDKGSRIAVESNGYTHVTGWTASPNFPLKNPIYSTLGGNTDAFVVALNATGVLQHSTFLGGSSWDYGNDIASDSLGNAFVAGNTRSTNFPVKDAYDATSGSSGAGDYYDSDSFVAKLKAYQLTTKSKPKSLLDWLFNILTMVKEFFTKKP